MAKITSPIYTESFQMKPYINLLNCHITTHEVHSFFIDISPKCSSPSLKTIINMLCREIVDLLKTTDCCQLLMSRYIPAYHHHFGRQCRVADYGFTRLVDLFDAISHVVQILGSGTKRTITLTHSAQMRRFTSDMLRVLKSQVSKLVSFTDFPTAYDKVFSKSFNPVEYGLCSLEDLLEEVPEGTVVISKVDSIMCIAIPKKEQTVEEVKQTKQFALEVVELLRHSPYYSISFNKFVPAYHHHFGRQCKVSDYGFIKLAELFEAIPETVEMEGVTDVDRKVKLRLPLALKVLGTQVQMLIKGSELEAISMEILSSVYKRVYKYTLKPQAFACKDLWELVSKLSDFVQIVHGSAGPVVTLSDIDTRTLEIRVWALLLEPPHCCSIMTFIHDYRVRFFTALPITKLEQLKNAVVLSNNGTETVVSLTEYYSLAARLYHLLYANGGRIQLSNISNVYSHKFGKALSISNCGVDYLEDLLKRMNFLVILKGSSEKLNVELNRGLSAYGINLPPCITGEAQRGSDKKQESLQLSPPAAHGLTNNFWRTTPSKPDTPPAPVNFTTNCNISSWNTSTKRGSNLNLSIPLPSVDTSKVFVDAEGPNSHILNPSLNPVIPKITAPHPTVLPLPHKLIMKDDSKIEYTVSDNEMYLSERLHSSVPVRRPGNSTKTFSTFSM